MPYGSGLGEWAGIPPRQGFGPSPALAALRCCALLVTPGTADEFESTAAQESEHLIRSESSVPPFTQPLPQRACIIRQVEVGWRQIKTDGFLDIEARFHLHVTSRRTTRPGGVSVSWLGLDLHTHTDYQRYATAGSGCNGRFKCCINVSHDVAGPGVICDYRSGHVFLDERGARVGWA